MPTTPLPPTPRSLKGDSLTLNEAIDVCRTYEDTLSQLTQLHAEREKTSMHLRRTTSALRGARWATSAVELGGQ